MGKCGSSGGSGKSLGTSAAGTVNLIRRQRNGCVDREKYASLRRYYRYSGALGRHRYSRYRVPNHKPFLHGVTVVLCREAMAARTKVLATRPLRGKQPLGMAR